jgi:hypothetical protein
MKRYVRYASPLLVAMFLFFVSANLTLAQDDLKSSARTERLRRIMDSQANIEEFRQEYLNYLSELENTMRLFNEVPAVREKFNRSGLKPIEKIAEAKNHIAEASVEELTLMRKVYAKVPDWREAPKSLNSLLKPEFRQKLEASFNSKKEGEIVLMGIADDCGFALQQDHTNTDISIARGVSLAAAAIMEGFPTDGLTILARIAPIAAWAAAEGAVIGIETLKSIKDDCNANTFEAGITNQITNSTNSIISNDNTNTTAITTSVSNAQTAITTNDNTNTTNIISNDNSNKTAIITNDNTNTTNIVNNDNANKTAIINNDNANTVTITTAVENAKTQVIINANANKDELLRLQIHADLATADSATPVAVFVLPAAKNGYLELVRTIVVQMITDLAGSRTAEANALLAQGDAHKNAGNFKSAYSSYRKAYQTAAR